MHFLYRRFSRKALTEKCVRVLIGMTVVWGSLGFQVFGASEENRYAEWVEPDFPFYSSCLDLRELDSGSVPFNVTPRGLILNLGHNQWACYDTELLRVSAIWEGNGVTPVGLAQVSYQNGTLDTPGGQRKLPSPDGSVWLINGVYPGWLLGETASDVDPRPAQPSEEEPGRGPLKLKEGSFQAIRVIGESLVLEYVVAGSLVEEQIVAREERGGPLVTRQFRLAPCNRERLLVLGMIRGDIDFRPRIGLLEESSDNPMLEAQNGLWVVRVKPNGRSLRFAVGLSPADQEETSPIWQSFPDSASKGASRWPEFVETQAREHSDLGAFALDGFDLPYPNPWNRGVRLADLQFFQNGAAAGVTLDGDVWIIEGLSVGTARPEWRRFASGLHEPMSLVIRDDQIFVYDRNGIWLLKDVDGNGEADRYELFYNGFTQSADNREFPNSIKLAPDRSFVISKGGQQSTTLSRLNGSVLRIASDGTGHSVLGSGFRQPFVGVDPVSGLVTASDQEGQYVPTTPIQIVDGGAFYGFISHLLPKEEYPAPIAEPLTWIPHSVNPSGASQIWLRNANMGPLDDALIHTGFNRPELFHVLINRRGTREQAAVISLARDFGVPVLNGAINPKDGYLYVSGFQVSAWGTTAKWETGLLRYRYTGERYTQPIDIAWMNEGLLLRFNEALDPVSALELANYSVERWNYKRTFKYGSGHYKRDGSLGQEWLTPSSAYLSEDGKAVFLGVRGLEPVMQMRLGWTLKLASGETAANNAYFTPYEFSRFDPRAEGFGDIRVDLSPPDLSTSVESIASAEEGERLYQLMGCMACHATEANDQRKVGPSWAGLYGSKRVLAEPKGEVIADEAYLRESILDPSAKVIGEFRMGEVGMPIYAGILDETQIESLILFIKSL